MASCPICARDDTGVGICPYCPACVECHLFNEGGSICPEAGE